MLNTKSLSTHHAVKLRCLRSVAFCSAAFVAALAPSGAYAAGTLAGTDITNIATASYETGGSTVEINSNPVVITVDELLDVTAVSSDAGDVVTTNGAVNVVSTFRITNTGNGPEAFRLIPNVVNGGDDFDPTLVQVILDTNGNGVYDPGVDTIYVAGTNDPLLAPDQITTVFVLTNVPASQDNGDRAQIRLTTAATTGTGLPGTTFATAGEGGGNAVVGTTGADADATGFLLINAASVALVKSASVADPFGGTTSVPGSIITYTLVATVSGSGTLTNLAINDPIPASSQYVASSITLEGGAMTDATDADQGNFNGSRVSVALGNVPAGQTRTVTFKVRVQ
jgi:uncharacterized repeat protein (TIGR01451 family)